MVRRQRGVSNGKDERVRGVVTLTAHSEGGVLEKVLVASQVVQLDRAGATKLKSETFAGHFVKRLDVEERTDARRIPVLGGLGCRGHVEDDRPKHPNAPIEGEYGKQVGY